MNTKLLSTITSTIFLLLLSLAAVSDVHRLTITVDNATGKKLQLINVDPRHCHEPRANLRDLNMGVQGSYYCQHGNVSKGTSVKMHVIFTYKIQGTNHYCKLSIGRTHHDWQDDEGSNWKKVFCKIKSGCKKGGLNVQIEADKDSAKVTFIRNGKNKLPCRHHSSGGSEAS